MSVLAGGSNEPLISSIILNYNGMNLVERCLKSVLSTDYLSFEVVFVDNASTDGIVELTRDSELDAFFKGGVSHH